MLKIQIREGENIERAIKRYKRKCRNVKLKEKVKEKKHYIKKSVRRREEIKKAQYREKYLNEKNKF